MEDDGYAIRSHNYYSVTLRIYSKQTFAYYTLDHTPRNLNRLLEKSICEAYKQTE